MVRRLGPEGLSAVRVFGDDVAEVIVKEGPESLSVLRKGGRGGWSFFTKQVLPHKKKLAAAGVLVVFLADPEKFVDYAGQATEFAVREFAKAGIQLASTAGVSGQHAALEIRSARPWPPTAWTLPILRWIGMGLAGLGRLGQLLILLGLPIRWMLRPFALVFRPIGFLIHLLTFRSTRGRPWPNRTRSDRDGSLAESSIQGQRHEQDQE